MRYNQLEGNILLPVDYFYNIGYAMLEEYKQLYIQSADLIPNWKDLSVLELANKYIELEKQHNEYSNSYISAIICRYGYLIQYYYNKQQYKFATPENCYEWLIDAINYTLVNHVWTEPKSKLYNDPEAPNKAILICISSIRSNFYTASKRQKRILNNKKLNFNQLSKFEEESEEDCLDRLLRDTNYSKVQEDRWFREFIQDKIKEEFNNKEYFNAFALDAIINLNVFKEYREGNTLLIALDKKRFQHHFRYIKAAFCKWFAKEYNLDEELVENSIKYINNLTNDKFNRNLHKLYNSILKDKDFRIFLDLE